MKNINKKISATLVTLVLLLTFVFAPTASAASATFSTESEVKKALYALAAYDCISNSFIQGSTAIGNSIDSIFDQSDLSKPVYVGQWLGDDNGNITCKTAIDEVFGTGKINKDMLKNGKIFYGVYEETSSVEKGIKCNYNIINSSATGVMEGGPYTWPQGYTEDIDGDGQPENYRSHGAITIFYDDDGPIRISGNMNNIDASHVLDSMRNINIDWSNSNPGYICQPLVMYTEVYAFDTVNLQGEKITGYLPILATDDDTPVNEWGIHVDDSYHAWVSSTSSYFTYTPVSPSSSSTKLVTTNNARTKLLENFSSIYLGGSTGMQDFLQNHVDAKYILYGRYLFNGDGNASFACNGISISKDDPNLSSLNMRTDYWNVGQPYVAEIQAYKNGGSSNKSNYITKFGGNGLAEPGAVTTINLPGVSGNCKTIAEEFNNINPTIPAAKRAVASYINVSTIDELPEENTNVSGGSVGSADVNELTECLNNAGSLGWILCPVLNIVRVTTEKFYDDIANNWLPVESNNIRASNGEAVYDGWKTVRTFANIIFAIMLTIVILSQLTGIGLSNYSIKKSLPSLIIVAVLVNISFLICQLLVDTTNILGAEAGKLVAGIGASITGDSAEFGFGTAIKGAIANIFAFAGVGAGAVAATVTAISNPGLLIPILISGIGIVISLFVFFTILAIRKAGIYLLIIFAPIAIICYALPNTKNIFDKWKRMFLALLLVYPICQLLVGGGQMISHIMLADSNNGFTYNLVAVILSFAPIFFIPSIIRSSMTALGNLGNRLQMLGNRFRGGVTSGLRKSESLQRAQTAMGNFGATRGESLLKNVNDKLRNAKGIGRIVSGLEDSGLGSAISKQRARARNQRIANYQKLMLGDNEADYLSSNLDPDQALENQINKQNAELRERLVNDAMSSIVAGKASYDGGTIDPNDSKPNGSMSRALDYYMDRYNASGGKDESSLIWAQALTKRMIETGDTTRTHAMQKIHDRSFNQDGSARSRVDQATSSLAKYISDNGQWMAKLKAEDNGSFKLIPQLAQNGYAESSRSAINTGISQSLRPNQVSQLSDRVFNSLKQEIKDKTFENDYDAASNLIAMDKVIQQAMSNPNTASDIKTAEIADLNMIHREAYIARERRALQEADWANQNGALMNSMPESEWKAQMVRDLKAHPENYAQGIDVDMSGYRDFDPTRLPVPH